MNLKAWGEREGEIEAANYCKNFSTDCVNIYKYTENDKKNVVVHKRSNFPSQTHPKIRSKFFITHFHFYTCQIRIWLMVSY